MSKNIEFILSKLCNYALIVRKYNLGDKSRFFSDFPDIDNSILENAWEYGLKKIQNPEIVKDASSLRSEDSEIVKRRIGDFQIDSDITFRYLLSELDVKRLKLNEENIERRLRNRLACEYLKALSDEILQLQKKIDNSFKKQATKLFDKIKLGLVIILIIGGFSAPRIITGLTPVDKLTEKIHKASGYQVKVGAICRDGWHSNATGRGACSHHGGVKEWIYITAYHKTIEECKMEASQKSWRD